MSLVAVLRASNRSQPNTVTEIRYGSRNSTVRDHVMITGCNGTPAHQAGNEFRHGTGCRPECQSWAVDGHMSQEPELA